MLNLLIASCSSQVLLALVNADMIPQLITILSPLSLSFTNAQSIHTYLISNVTYGVMLATLLFLTDFKSDSHDEQQAVCETVLKQVLAPSETYIRHLCANRYSIVDGYQCEWFLDLLAQLLQTCPSYQPTMDFVLRMPRFSSFRDNNHAIFENGRNGTCRSWCLAVDTDNEDAARTGHAMTKDAGRSATLLLGKVEMEDSSGLSTRCCQTMKNSVASELLCLSMDLDILLGQSLPLQGR
ncbi:hypothetical protein BLNAU_5459 [Blattamonas nauphoetae]|uniref:Uncharacterized protein n=1 Tax=Blattamonas nauphoetae TaxID=2049346 RepID=A0ABQ9Y7D7_9EUKA|nr:hypothetical protein BLNAU_5459 [Blattamonas nauphoetae]